MQIIGGNMRSLWFGVFLCAAMFVACGDDDSDFATRPSDGSSSSVCEDCDDESSSSVTPKSSDSETSVSSSSTKSSSSSVKSSSSTNSSSSSAMSSSSVTQQSSSSETSVSSSSTESSSSSAKVDGSEYDAIANTLKDLRDGQTYKTVKIGDQVWMAENLNFETDSSFCYNDSVEYCEKYGRLYTWAVAMDSAGAWTTNGKDCGYGEDCSPTYPVRGVCPEGWHLPSMDEWDTLFTAAGDSSVAWTKLKSTSGWYNGGNGTDDLGFSVFPAGERFRKDGDYYYEGYNAFFWSSTEFVSYTAFYRYLHYSSDYVLLDYESKNFGFSVRCLQD